MVLVVAALGYTRRILGNGGKEGQVISHHEVVWTIGGAFLVLTVPLTLSLSWQHLTNFVEPRQQSQVCSDGMRCRRITTDADPPPLDTRIYTNTNKPQPHPQTIRIIWTVPVYSTTAWLCLRFPENVIYIQCVREVYEAYVIYCFLQYLVYYLGEEHDEMASAKLAKVIPRPTTTTTTPTHMTPPPPTHTHHPEFCHQYPAIVGHHKPPFCCLPPWVMGAEFLNKCKTGVLQFVVVRFCTTILAVVLQSMGTYGEGQYDVRNGFFWVWLVNSASQGWALYVLFLFYHATHKDLKEIHPFGKVAVPPPPP